MLDKEIIEIETHPFEPFLPRNAKVLFLGTFPAKPIRWSMNFYYPNFLNDMWRIMGLLFYDDPMKFEINSSVSDSSSLANDQFASKKKRFDQKAIMDFCAEKGIALSDTAEKIRRLKGNASDAFLEVVKSRNLSELLAQIPECKAIVTTGEKATSVLCSDYNVDKFSIGECVPIIISNKEYSFYRMPSTSRAYPLSLDRKAEFYREMFKDLEML